MEVKTDLRRPACSTEQECNQPNFCRQTGGCERVEDSEGWRAVAWMHEFKDPYTGDRRQEPRLHRPQEWELQPGDVVSPLYFRLDADQMRAHGELCARMATEAAAKKCEQIAAEAEDESPHKNYDLMALYCAEAIRSL